METIPGRVMIFGVFDHLNIGERSFIDQAREEAEELIIAVATDVMAGRFKDQVQHSERDRLERVQRIYPDCQVVMGDWADPMANIRKYRPSLVCLGFDQVGFSEMLRRDHPEIEIRRMKPYPEGAH